MTFDYDERYDYIVHMIKVYVPVLQIVSFVLLTATILFIFYYLTQQEQGAEDKNMFRKESCQLCAILIIFDFSYAVRAVWDAIAPDILSHGVGIVLLQFTISFPVCDYLPIMCILFFHTRNFKLIKFQKLDQDASSQIEGENLSQATPIEARSTLLQLEVANSQARGSK